MRGELCNLLLYSPTTPLSSPLSPHPTFSFVMSLCVCVSDYQRVCGSVQIQPGRSRLTSKCDVYPCHSKCELYRFIVQIAESRCPMSWRERNRCTIKLIESNVQCALHVNAVACQYDLTVSAPWYRDGWLHTSTLHSCKWHELFLNRKLQYLFRRRAATDGTLLPPDLKGKLRNIYVVVVFNR